MTISIRVEEQTAQALQAKADALGMTLGAYLQFIAGAGELEPLTNGTADSAAEFDAALDDFFQESPRRLPSLPADFSRADIYADHD